jgi:hypothetical protein
LKPNPAAEAALKALHLVDTSSIWLHSSNGLPTRTAPGHLSSFSSSPQKELLE